MVVIALNSLRLVSRLLPIALLILTLLGTGGTPFSGVRAVGPASLLPQVQHPLLYRPASTISPGVPPYAPSDLRSGYDFNPLYVRGINGTGTRIAIIDAFGDPSMSKDLSSFDSQTGLPAPTMNTYYPDGAPTTRDSGWAVETALDVEWAHAIAPSATIDLVVAFDSGLGHVYDAMSLVANTLTNETVLSMSFGLSENQYPTTGSLTIAATHQLFVTMTSHGTTPFASSGDNGATTCCNVSYPASDPLVVAVGGTTLNLDTSAKYVSETTWSGSGAGSSIVFAKPSWQQGLGDSMRDIADVSYDADPNTGVLVVQNGQRFEVGGTSASSPQWAGLTALTSQATRHRYGSIASKLYSPRSYHDITSGSNGFFSAGPGWDYPTGLGTPDANLFVSSFTPPSASIQSSSVFQGLNVTTIGSLLVNNATMTVSGTATVRATNATTGSLVFSRNYTLTNIRLQNETTSLVSRFLLSIPVSPYHLSVDVSLTVQSSKTTVQVVVTRLINLSATGTVNISDVTTVMADYGSTMGSPGYNPQADLAANGIVGITDVTIAILYYGSSVFS
jgi:subtilase family serine protease